MRSVAIILSALTLLPISSSASFWDHLVFEGSIVMRSIDGTETKSNRTFDITQPTSTGIRAFEYEIGKVDFFMPHSDPWGYNLKSKEKWGLGCAAGYRLGEDWTLMFAGLAYYMGGNNRYSEDWVATARGFEPTTHGTYRVDNTLHMYDIELMVEYDLRFAGLFLTAGRKFTLIGRRFHSEITIMDDVQVLDLRVQEFDQWSLHLALSGGLGIARPVRPFGHVVILANYTFRQFTAGWTLRSAIRFTI